MATPTSKNEWRKQDPKPPSESTPLLGSHNASVSPPISYSSSDTSPGDSSNVNPPSEDPQHAENDCGTLQRGARLRVILILLIAVFISNADRSLVLATHPSIGSEFGALHWSSWLVTAFGLAGAAAQTIFGKLGELYGCKPVILFCYLGFAIGCVVVAVAQSMSAVILGRVLSGSVGAGMTVLVSIIISDLVPLRESAAWRSHVNVAATTGRSFGGPLGGWLADTVGWRWSFGIQAPILLVATFLCWQSLPDNLGEKASQRRLLYKDFSRYEKLAKLDFLGAFLLAMTILLVLLPMELGGNEVPWSHPVVPSLFVAASISLTVFVFIEKRWSKEPVLDLDLFMQRDLALCLLIAALQSAAQAGTMFSVPLYFQVTQQVSNSKAGAHLLPGVLGNALGGILCVYSINRTGSYIWLIYVSTLTTSCCYLLLLTTWHGNTNCIESFYILPGGFGMGMTYSALFVAIQAAAKSQQVPATISTLSLCSAVGAVAGVASTGAAIKSGLGRSLETKLHHLGLDAISRQKILIKAATDITSIHRMRADIKSAVISSYVDSLLYGHGVSLVFVLLGLILVVGLREYKVGRQ